MTEADANAAFVAEYRSDASRDELSAALLVAHILAPDVDDADVRRQLAALLERLIVMPGAATAGGLMDFLRGEGFQGATDMQSFDCSRIDRVLAQRRGIPITLSIPYLVLGRGV